MSYFLEIHGDLRFGASPLVLLRKEFPSVASASAWLNGEYNQPVAETIITLEPDTDTVPTAYDGAIISGPGVTPAVLLVYAITPAAYTINGGAEIRCKTEEVDIRPKRTA